ncbi:MAG: efflux RND transporter permease subunit, partial [Spirochaetales bacterium]
RRRAYISGLSTWWSSTALQGDLVSIRTVGEYGSLDELSSTVVGSAGGVPVTLGEVAEVRLAAADRATIPVRNGREVIAIDVTKRTEGDTVAITDAIEGELERFTRDRAGAVSFTLVRDQRREVATSIASVRNAALLGGALAIIVVFLFLREIRTTTIIAISIPVSVLLAISALYVNGQSFNVTTLGGLTVAVGMIVDSSIVVLESIFQRYESGLSPREAARVGAAEVGSAVLASTTTSLSVFVPLLFVEGLVGLLLKDVAWTMSFALAGSMISALLIVPFLSSKLLPEERKPQRQNPSAAATRNTKQDVQNPGRDRAGRMQRFYSRALEVVLGESWFTVVVAVGLLVITAALFPLIGFAFLPTGDSGEITFSIRTGSGSTLEETEAKTRQIEAIALELVPNREDSLFIVGQPGEVPGRSSSTGAFGFLIPGPSRDRDATISELVQMLEERVRAEVPGVQVTVQSSGPADRASAVAGAAGFTVRLTGPDIETVGVASGAVEALMLEDPNVLSVRSNAEEDLLEIVADLDHEAMGRLGVNAQLAGSIGRIVFAGREVGLLDVRGSQVPIRVVSAYANEAVGDDIWNLVPVASTSGRTVTFAAFIRASVERGFSSIPHVNRQVAVDVTATLRGGDVRDTNTRVTEALERLALPPGVDWEIEGAAQAIAESFTSLLLAVLVAVFLVYVVMVVQFERYRQPLIILSSIPFTLIGVGLALVISGTALSVISFLGIIALAGIVVNNAIVMVDKINQLRDEEGLALREAVVEGAATRLRPILMTTLTTVFGLIPMALALGEGSELLAPLGQAIAGGLITSTLVTLFLTPTIYWIVERAVERRKSGTPGAPATPGRTPEGAAHE